MEQLRHTPEQRRLSDSLDMYKLYMGQVALTNHLDTEVTFTMKNRAEAPLAEYVDIDQLNARFEEICTQGFTAEEIAYYAGLKAEDGSVRFDEHYLDYLAGLQLGEVSVTFDEVTQDLAVHTTGPWANVSLWETVVMSEINEHYYQQYLAKNDLSVEDVFAEGDRRLDEKIALLAKRPDIKFADFGTRRRFSTEWHEHVIQRLANELPENCIGTSNPWFAHKYNLKPIGTYAHEMPMVYAALSDAEGNNPLHGHKRMLEDWEAQYGGELSIALTDTFTTEFFFKQFTKEQAQSWHGLRHDSGDPIAFGEQAIAFYESHGIDPRTKQIVFSDGLHTDTIIALADHFKDRIDFVFGWGTDLMNDLGIKANNFVVKATKANGIDTVKLSDDYGKHTGPASQVARYQMKVAEYECVPA